MNDIRRKKRSDHGAISTYMSSQSQSINRIPSSIESSHAHRPHHPNVPRGVNGQLTPFGAQQSINPYPTTSNRNNIDFHNPKLVHLSSNRSFGPGTNTKPEIPLMPPSMRTVASADLCTQRLPHHTTTLDGSSIEFSKIKQYRTSPSHAPESRHPTAKSASVIHDPSERSSHVKATEHADQISDRTKPGRSEASYQPSHNMSWNTFNKTNHNAPSGQTPMTRRVEKYTSNFVTFPQNKPNLISQKIVPYASSQHFRATRQEIDAESRLGRRRPENAWKGDVNQSIGKYTDNNDFSESTLRCTDLWKEDNRPVDMATASAGFQKCLDTIRQAYDSTNRDAYHFRQDYPSGLRPPQLDSVLHLDYLDESGQRLMGPLNNQFREPPEQSEVRSWSVPLIGQCNAFGGKPIQRMNYKGARVVSTRVLSSTQHSHGIKLPKGAKLTGWEQKRGSATVGVSQMQPIIYPNNAKSRILNKSIPSHNKLSIGSQANLRK